MAVALRVASAMADVLADPRFDAGLAHFSRGVPGAFRREQRLVRSIGDLGMFAVVAVLIAYEAADEVTLAEIQRVVCPRLASARRVRAIVAELTRIGAVEQRSAPDDTRRRPFKASGWLMDTLVAWLRPQLVAAHPWIVPAGPTVQTEQECVLLYFNQWVDAFLYEAFLLADGYPVVMTFMNHLGGYPFLLALVASWQPRANGEATASVSRKAFARDLGLSRAHFTALLARAERRGWMQRHSGGHRVTITPAVHIELHRWVARELAWIADVVKSTADGHPSA
jgi:hypothetical protein